MAADDILIFFTFNLSKKIKLDFSCDSSASARQRIHLKHQILFSLKNNEKIFMNINNSKNLNPSCKMDLDFRDCFGRESLILKPKK